jgi:hypothetical protein
MASARKFPVNRPSGYHWDFFASPQIITCNI